MGCRLQRTVCVPSACHSEALNHAVLPPLLVSPAHRAVRAESMQNTTCCPHPCQQHKILPLDTSCRHRAAPSQPARTRPAAPRLRRQARRPPSLSGGLRQAQFQSCKYSKCCGECTSRDNMLGTLLGLERPRTTHCPISEPRVWTLFDGAPEAGKLSTRRYEDDPQTQYWRNPCLACRSAPRWPVASDACRTAGRAGRCRLACGGRGSACGPGRDGDAGDRLRACLASSAGSRTSLAASTRCTKCIIGWDGRRS